jgi:hypothetical protein
MVGKESKRMNMERNERQEARERLVTALLEGQSWQAVSEGSDVPLKRAMAYRLLHQGVGQKRRLLF